MVGRPPEAADDQYVQHVLLPFQPGGMKPAQLAAVSYLARYTGDTLYAYQLRRLVHLV